MCLNLDKTGLGPAVSVGLKSDLDPKRAILGSIRESQQVRQWIRNLWIQRNGPKISKPEDIKEIEDRGFYWYNLDRINDLDYLLNSTDIKDIRETQSQVDEKKDLVTHLKRKGIDSYSVDLTAEPFKEAGFYVVRAIQPQLHPLFLDEAFPCYWSKRLETKLNGSEVNKMPHPFM
jgi:ribosomal protein S12 methylthiotransferase accessory factor YcaO